MPLSITNKRSVTSPFSLILAFFALLALFCFNSLYAQVGPSIEWQKCLGGMHAEQAWSIQQTSDGGFIVAGLSESGDGDVYGLHGSSDYWIVKLDLAGNLIWQKCLGGSNLDQGISIQQTTDGGFIVAGSSGSIDDDVSGNHGSSDYWIVKLDASGNLVWQKSLGGSQPDIAASIQQTYDGGFIVAGYSYSNDGDVTGWHEGYFQLSATTDSWIVRLDTVGNIVWEKSLGGNSYENPNVVQQTPDGGFIIAGATSSSDGDVLGWHVGNDFQNAPTADYWIVKLDADGNLAWQKCLGGTDNEVAYSIVQTTNGGFIVAGYARSTNGDVSGNHGWTDCWIVKLDSSGNLLWQKSLGGSDADDAYSIQPTNDGGFIVAGNSWSIDGDVSGNHGSSDDWIVKVDSVGNLLWQKCLGGSKYDFGYSVLQTTDDGFIVAGSSISNDGDVSGNHLNYDYYGDTVTAWDYWIVKLSANLCSANFYLSADTLTPHHYWGVNTSTGAASLSYYWSWGDGSYDSVPYPSHTYATGGFYSICLTIHDSTGCTDSTCYSYQVQKMSSAQAENTMVYVNIVSDIPTAAQNPDPHQQLLVFPNPAQSQLFINLTAPANEVTIRVYDLQGRRIVLPETFVNTQAQLNTTTLVDGFYTLQITNNKFGESEVTKFVKQ